MAETRYGKCICDYCDASKRSKFDQQFKLVQQIFREPQYEGTELGNAFPSVACDLCENSAIGDIPRFPVYVREFLGVENVCQNCQNLVDDFVLRKHHLCYINAPTAQMQLALLDVLRFCLVGEIGFVNKASRMNWFGHIRRRALRPEYHEL